LTTTLRLAPAPRHPPARWRNLIKPYIFLPFLPPSLSPDANRGGQCRYRHHPAPVAGLPGKDSPAPQRRYAPIKPYPRQSAGAESENLAQRKPDLSIRDSGTYVWVFWWVLTGVFGSAAPVVGHALA